MRSLELFLLLGIFCFAVRAQLLHQILGDANFRDVLDEHIYGHTEQKNILVATYSNWLNNPFNDKPLVVLHLGNNGIGKTTMATAFKYGLGLVDQCVLHINGEDYLRDNFSQRETRFRNEVKHFLMRQSDSCTRMLVVAEYIQYFYFEMAKVMDSMLRGGNIEGIPVSILKRALFIFAGNKGFFEDAEMQLYCTSQIAEDTLKDLDIPFPSHFPKVDRKNCILTTENMVHNSEKVFEHISTTNHQFYEYMNESEKEKAKATSIQFLKRILANIHLFTIGSLVPPTQKLIRLYARKIFHESKIALIWDYDKVAKALLKRDILARTIPNDNFQKDLITTLNHGAIRHVVENVLRPLFVVQIIGKYANLEKEIVYLKEDIVFGAGGAKYEKESVLVEAIEKKLNILNIKYKYYVPYAAAKSFLYSFEPTNLEKFFRLLSKRPDYHAQLYADGRYCTNNWIMSNKCPYTVFQNPLIVKKQSMDILEQPFIISPWSLY